MYVTAGALSLVLAGVLLSLACIPTFRILQCQRTIFRAGSGNLYAKRHGSL